MRDKGPVHVDSGGGILGTILAGVIAIILIILALTHLSWTLFFIIGFVIIVIASIVWLAWEIQK